MVVPSVTATATLGDMNMAIKIATWLAKVYEAGPMTTLGANIGISIPIAISTADEVNANTLDLFVIFSKINPPNIFDTCLDTCKVY